MAGKGESPYNIKQEGKFGWLWTAHLNCSSRGTFVKHSCMNLSNTKEHRSYRNILCNYSGSDIV